LWWALLSKITRLLSEPKLGHVTDERAADPPTQATAARTAMTFRLGKWVKFMNAEPTL
jgi:hypothetical protein